MWQGREVAWDREGVERALGLLEGLDIVVLEPADPLPQQPVTRGGANNTPSKPNVGSNFQSLSSNSGSSVVGGRERKGSVWQEEGVSGGGGGKLRDSTWADDVQGAGKHKFVNG